MNNLNDIFFAPAANQDLTYEQILEDVQRYFAENHAATIAEAGDGNTDRASSLLKELMVQYIVKRKYAIEGLTTEELCEKLYEDMAGYSFLKKWIYKPGMARPIQRCPGGLRRQRRRRFSAFLHRTEQTSSDSAVFPA